MIYKLSNIFLPGGLIAGWRGGLAIGRPMGFIANALIAIAGALVGSYLFDLTGPPAGGGLSGVIMIVTAGTVVLLGLPQHEYA